MTLDDLKNAPLKRGVFLLHGTLGLVEYRGKVRHKPEEIVIRRTDLDKKDKAARVIVNISSVSRDGTRPGGKIQGSRLILAHCPDCGLKIRAVGKWFKMGTPHCFNESCPTFVTRSHGGRPLEIEWGEKGDGVLNVEGWRGEMREDIVQSYQQKSAELDAAGKSDVGSPDDELPDHEI